MAKEIASLAESFVRLRKLRKENAARPSSIAARKAWKIKNREKMLVQQREYNMRPEVAEKRRKFYENDRVNNRERHKKRVADYYQANKSKIHAKAKLRLDSNPTVRLSARLRSYIGNTLRGRNFRGSGGRILMLVGCSMDQLKSHIESQFQPGMSWDNWTRTGWHIDHIQPLASFDLTKQDQLKLAFHYTNLKPEWAEINLSKNSIHNGHKWTYKDHPAVV